MSPERLRAYVLILTRDVVPPAMGVFFSVKWGDTLQPWQLPILAALFGVPLVAPRRKTDSDDSGDGTR